MDGGGRNIPLNLPSKGDLRGWAGVGGHRGPPLQGTGWMFLAARQEGTSSPTNCAICASMGTCPTSTACSPVACPTGGGVRHGWKHSDTDYSWK